MLNKFLLSFSVMSLLIATTTSETAATPVNELKTKTTSDAAQKTADEEQSIKKDDQLFDNTSMARVLLEAELLTKSDMVAAKQQWKRVIEFMHKPRWFPTAAMVPVSLRFAKLADICIKRDETHDAHELMHASFEFPFHIKKDEEEIDAVASRLIAYDKRTGNLEECKTFLEYAIEKSVEPRRSTYQEWLQSLVPKQQK